MHQLNTKTTDFDRQFKKLLDRKDNVNPKVIEQVQDILDQVKTHGDSALIKLTKQFDHWSASCEQELFFEPSDFKSAWNHLSPKLKQAMQTAYKRIHQFHELQAGFQTFHFSEDAKTKIGQHIVPIKKIGLYVPGGQAAYPSSVLMNAIPAKIAGVKDMTMTSPIPNGLINQNVLAAAYLCDIKNGIKIGGAQAIAALCYGTESIQPVDKIVGPGNEYVALAKKFVFGKVGIDMIAGPSEILIIADSTIKPDWLAMDLFSQAEHDQNAQAILITQNQKLLNETQKSINKLLPKMSRQKIIEASLNNKGALILAHSEKEVIDLINQIAPEHLELAIKNPHAIIEKIENAGTIFMGKYTCEALGDYCAGPNHVLPTSGSARFSSGLGVYDFQKRINTIECSKQFASQLGKVTETLANDEKLSAHAQSAKFRTL